MVIGGHWLSFGGHWLSFGGFGAGGEFAFHVLGHGGKDLFAGFVGGSVGGAEGGIGYVEGNGWPGGKLLFEGGDGCLGIA